MKHVLHNDGIVAINADSQLPKQRTLIVLGAPRGGTTMVAGSLAKLGVFMGDRLPATYEDSRLLKMISDRQYGDVHKVIKERNSHHDVWGWKQPNEFDAFFTNVLDEIRNPIFFVIVRDVVAIGNRNRISALTDVTSSMLNNLQLYKQLLDKVISSGHPSVFISYEKALLDPSEYMHRIAEFSSNPTSEQIEDAIAFVRPSPSDYLESARVTEAKGAVDTIEPRRITGWAFFPKRPTTPVRLNLIVNGQLISSADAITYRKDLLEKKLHPSGKCGFSFLLEGISMLADGDEVQIRAEGDTKFLGRGTYRFSASK